MYSSLSLYFALVWAINVLCCVSLPACFVWPLLSSPGARRLLANFVFGMLRRDVLNVLACIAATLSHHFVWWYSLLHAFKLSRQKKISFSML